MNVSAIVKDILKDGIREYKFLNSKIKPIHYQAHGKKGAMFAFRSKKQMMQARGVVLTSLEALNENENKFTHWTPNVYSYGAYADEARTVVKGHNEQNLQQINTFVIDFDKVPGETLDAQRILDVAIDLGLMPTLILETPGGFQAYFILENAWYISSKNNYQSIKVAKRVSENLRKAFAEELSSVDLGCNHFGIARIPRKDNVVYYYPALKHDMQQLIQWSMKYEPAKTVKKPNLSLVQSEYKQVKEKWYQLLISNPKIVGTKGKLGRNNVIFTLSLANYASGITLEDCLNEMDLFNSALANPLKDNERVRIVKSAYSGKYRGANKEYVRALVAEWGLETFSEAGLFTQQRTAWYKFKKDRHERKQSHLSEWKTDLLSYLETQCYDKQPELEVTKAELQANIVYQGKAIPKRSLDRALKELQAEGKICLKTKFGRGGGLVVATRKALIRAVIMTNQQLKTAYKDWLKVFVEEAAMLQTKGLQETDLPIITRQERQLTLWDTG
ncbi:primase C-terminal domain-containing protein [Enterococcus faecalis]|uniref:primase C-terminal domain-containing protein n=1 Tax=Enterococcus faecalis TaxID=1351 RepID=UPI000FFF47C8|nr:primase C-terminal domain-containing protein [Enterococcus faecalis]MBU5339964.1 primase C-terminal domain-containing protein [Enterococcus faecalis]MDJ9036980.1 primase C-terminal domain-containing protein [Enterococcus faecalis]MDJ9040033.1 primase C-terminal domain-containing protein [Enterococcus faecalis]MDK4429760.1 primase C-terminal domain-containing protein [Enterococcus faecalis]RXF40711.1 RepS protein [Enterococcus faecalis]